MHTYKSKSRINSFALFLNDTTNLKHIVYNNSLLLSIANVTIFNPIFIIAYSQYLFNYPHIYFYFCCHSL